VFEARPGDARPPRPGPDDDDRPRRPRDDYEDEDDRPRRRRRRTREDVIDDARRAVHLPGLLSAIVCLLAIAYHAVDLAVTLANPQLLKNNPLMFGQPPPPPEQIVAVKAFVFLYALVAAAGSFAMMRLKARPFAMTAMAMQLVPCLGPCCLLTLPLGIWGLVVLNNPDVKDGFELAAAEAAWRPARGRDRDRDDDHRGYDDEEDDRGGRDDRLR
jgi:hypothetical protein